MDWFKICFLFFLWFLLYALCFRNEERVVFIAVIDFFRYSWLSCICFKFQSIKPLSLTMWIFLKAFLFQRFLAVIDFIVVLHFWISINQAVFFDFNILKAFLFQRFLAVINFILVLHFWISINQAVFFDFV